MANNTKTALNYDLKFIDCVSTLSPITSQLIFKKEDVENTQDKKIVIKGNDSARQLLFTMEAPESYFNFTGSVFCLLDYNKFASYFNTFRPKDDAKAPTLSIEPDKAGEPDKVYINSQISTAEIRQTLADINVVAKPCFDNISSGVVDADFKFSDSQFAELKKMVGMIGADTATFKIEGDIVTVTLFSKASSDRFVQQYKMNITAIAPFELSTPAKTLSLIPDGGYHITIDKDGLVVYNQERKDDIKLTLFVCEV